MKIAVAKIGKSLKFASSYSPIGGDNEGPSLVKALANNNPNHTFYIIGRSDYKKLSGQQRAEIFPYNNVIDIWENFKARDEEDTYNRVCQVHDEISGFDYGVIMFGQVGTVTIPNRIEQVKNRHLIASVIDMTKNYSTPISKWLNERKPNWIELQNDPRYHSNQSRDMFHMPNKILSQYNYTLTSKHIKSYEDQDITYTENECVYSGIETLYLVGRTKPDLVELSKSKTEKFMVVLNEGSPSRYNMLKEWVLDSYGNVDVYGKWEHESAVSDSRFRGSLHIEELANKLKNVKYTFIIPIAPGWATSKYIEMIHNGVIPFFHPTYDSQKNLKVPDFLRLQKPSDLKKRIEFLENNPNDYLKLLQELQKVLRDEYYDGSFISDTIMKEIDINYERVDLSNYNKVEVKTLDNFFS